MDNHLFSRVKVAKNICGFATVTDGSEEVNFIEFSHEYGNLDTISSIYLENSMKFNSSQPSVMVAKGKISFATMTHGCKAVIIDKIRSLLKIRINQ